MIDEEEMRIINILSEDIIHLLMKAQLDPCHATCALGSALAFCAHQKHIDETLFLNFMISFSHSYTSNLKPDQTAHTFESKLRKKDE